MEAAARFIDSIWSDVVIGAESTATIRQKRTADRHHDLILGRARKTDDLYA